MTPMQILVNGSPERVPEDTTIADLVALKGLSGAACAAEVNRSLVPKRDHADRRLAEGDHVELVTLVGGG